MKGDDQEGREIGDEEEKKRKGLVDGWIESVLCNNFFPCRVSV